MTDDAEPQLEERREMVGAMFELAAVMIALDVGRAAMVCERHSTMLDGAPAFDTVSFARRMVLSCFRDERFRAECEGNPSRLPDMIRAHAPLCEYLPDSDFLHAFTHASGGGCMNKPVGAEDGPTLS